MLWKANTRQDTRKSGRDPSWKREDRRRRCAHDESQNESEARQKEEPIVSRWHQYEFDFEGPSTYGAPVHPQRTISFAAQISAKSKEAKASSFVALSAKAAHTASAKARALQPSARHQWTQWKICNERRKSVKKENINIGKHTFWDKMNPNPDIVTIEFADTWGILQKITKN